MKEWIKDKWETSKEWVMDRKDERTSLDGIVSNRNGCYRIIFYTICKVSIRFVELRCNHLWCIHFNQIRVVIWQIWKQK